MRHTTTKMMAACGALLLSATLASAQDFNTDKMTYVTFSAPVALPGVTLPAGSYMFRLLDSNTTRNVVQVFDRDRTKIFATLMAMPATRPEPADETVITFREAPVNAPPAVQYWYYPGQRDGQEFAYPKSQAVQIANAAHTSVLSMDIENGADMTKGGKMSRVEPGAATDTAQTEQSASNATAQSADTMGQQPRSSSTQSASDQRTAPAESAEVAAQPQSDTSTQTAQGQTATDSRDTSSQAGMPAPAPASTSSEATAVGTSGTASPSAVGTSGSADASASSMPQATSGTARPSTSSSSGMGDTSAASPARSSGDRLPNTGSELPLVGVAGLLALAAALGVRAVRRAA